MKTSAFQFLEENEKIELEQEEEKIEADTETTDVEGLTLSSRKLHTSRQDKAIIDLYRMIYDKEIVLSPDFQRRYVWTKKAASKFIESLLINIPIPTIFVSSTKEGKWDVVDGQQRLTAITQFLNNELQLTGLETLTDLNKEKYEDLDEKTKKILNNRTLSIVIIDDDSSEEIKFDIFMRINQGSVKLNEQELRNCLYRGPFMDAIKKMGENELFYNILKNKTTFIRRFQHLEIIERFFLMRELIDPTTFTLKEGSYGGRTTKSVNKFLKENQFLDQDSIAHYYQVFEDTIDKVYLVFGEHAFCQYKNAEYNYNINKAVAEIQLTLLSFLSREQIEKNKQFIQESFENIMSTDPKFMDALVVSTNNTNVINYRYQTWGKLLGECIK